MTEIIFWSVIIIQFVLSVRYSIGIRKLNAARQNLEHHVEKMTRMGDIYRELAKDVDQFVKNMQAGNFEATEHYSNEIHRLHQEFMQVK